MRLPCRWVAAYRDASGYASASRDYIQALLDRDDIELTTSAVSFEQQHTTHGVFESRILEVEDKPVLHKIQVLHLTPENYVKFQNPNVYNIAYTVWETDRLPATWVGPINSMNEVWVPSEWNKQVFINSGITKPIFVVPHVITLPDLSDAQPISMGVEPGTYVFHSIFQWTERKAPLVLLKAYLTEFGPEEKVCLAIKTYRLNTSAQEQQIIHQDIQNLKVALNIPSLLDKKPAMRFFGHLFTEEQMKGFYQAGDCFVLPSRSEGFGICTATAMAYAKPTIATRYSGCLDFMNDSNSYLVDCQETPVSHMLFGNYNGYMKWAEPDIIHLRKSMRYCFEHREEAAQKGKVAQASIYKQLNSQVVGEIIAKRLKEINKKI